MAGPISLRVSRLIPPIVGVVLTVGGAAVVAGRLVPLPSWATFGLSPDSISIPSAVGFLVCGAALLALQLGSWRIPFYLGGGTGLLALVLFSRYAFELFLEVPLAVAPPSTGVAQELLAIPPNSALGFALAGLALALARRAVATQALIGALVLTVGSVALLGHLTDVAGAYTWGAHDQMALPTSLGLALLGLAQVAQSLGRRGAGARAPWVPLAAGVATIMAGILFWHALRAQELEAFHRTTDATTTALARALEARLEPMVRAGDQLAARSVTHPPWQPPPLHEPATLLLGSLPGFRSLHWLEPPVRARGSEEPAEEAEPEAGDDSPAELADLEESPESAAVAEQRAALRDAILELSGPVTLTAVLGPLPEGEDGELAVLVPLDAPGSGALLLATFDAGEVFAPLAARGAPGYHFQVLNQGRQVFLRGTVPREDGRWSRIAPVGSPRLPWEVRLEPTSEHLAAQRTGLPELALGIGALLAVLLTFTVRLGEVETRRARAFEAEVRQRTGELEEALASLKAENRQRQRSEERLRRSQEVARLLSGELDLEVLAQGVTEAATELTGASFGVFLYHVVDERGETLAGCALSGLEVESLGPLAEPGPAWPHPRELAQGRCLRLADATQELRRRREPEYLPFTHLPLRSYLAVPVRSRSGELHGGLYFGHADPAVFSHQEEEIAVALAAQAAVAMDNAGLYDAERRARAAAQAASASKDRFLTTLGHELRNPLGSISTALEVLALEPQNHDLQRRMHDIVSRQIRQLARLVDDLLDVSRIERGKIAVVHRRLELLPLVRETVESHRPELEAAGLRLTLELPQGPIWVDADATRLAQILSNLVGNASKFTDSGGEITVEVAPHSGKAVVSVRDTGCGMAPNELTQVFEPFAQAETSSSRMAGGLGLGLTIARSLVQAHGGTMKADSAGPGKGSVVSFSLPMRRPQEQQTAARGSAPEGPPLRVLVVDDHLDAASGLAELLALLGHEAEVAHDGTAGLEAVQTMRPNLVISDLGMPGMDGFELARRLSRESLSPRPMLCALSGYADEDAVRRSREAGFDHHLTKPVDASQLEEVLVAAQQREVTPPTTPRSRTAERRPIPGR